MSRVFKPTRLSGFLFLPGLLVCLAAVLSLGAIPAWSQSTATGTVSGLVTDVQNAVIAGTQVKLEDVTTRRVLTTVTNDAGRYSFINVPPGTYNVTFTKTGFAVYQNGGSHCGCRR
ncbi:MAG TPA: carboxypeptidase-like regulatory domain-containing protein [Bryobacteraceae bacterium]|nr:carboxypeptidase-like regulatory domain-containing protein [Bryobacteraceae bacterium]